MFVEELARRVAEVRIAEERDARLVPHPPRDRGGLARDVGELLGGRALVDRGVGDEHRVGPADNMWMPNGVWPGRGVDHAAHLAQSSAKLRVTPVIIASASPSWSISAPKMLRSWLTIRSTSRRR